VVEKATISTTDARQVSNLRIFIIELFLLRNQPRATWMESFAVRGCL